MSLESSNEPSPGEGEVLKNIFGFLEKNHSSGDAADDVSPELRQKMEEFAKGQIPEKHIEGLCGEILSSPEAIRVFAEILGRMA